MNRKRNFQTLLRARQVKYALTPFLLQVYLLETSDEVQLVVSA